jgi:hypothetical protein
VKNDSNCIQVGVLKIMAIPFLEPMKGVFHMCVDSTIHTYFGLIEAINALIYVWIGLLTAQAGSIMSLRLLRQ